MAVKKANLRYSGRKTKADIPQMMWQHDEFLRKLAETRQAEILGNDDRNLTESEYDLIMAEITETKAMIDAEPLKYFCPNLAQEKMIKSFVNSFSESKIPTVMVTSANGVGKTCMAINILGNLIFGVQNKWFDYEIFRNFPYPKQIWLITTPNNLKTNYFSENLDSSSFNYWFQGKQWTPTKEGKDYYSKITFPNNKQWSINILTYYQDLKEFESATIGGVLLDEPCPEHIWNVLPSRLRKGGFYFMPMTPLDCDPYIKEDVMDKAENGVLGYKHIEASAFEVTTDKERGHLDPDVLRSQIEKYDQDEIEARVHGKLMYFKERIIDNWNDEIHFVEPALYPIKEDYQIFHVFDPADGRPNAEIWGAVTPEGRRIIFHESPEDTRFNFWEMKGGIPMDRHLKYIEYTESMFEQKFGFPITIKKRIVDYHFANQTRGVYKHNLLSDYRLAGVKNLYESYKGVQDKELPYGHRKIREALRIMPDGKPGLVVWNTCYHVRNGITKYVRKRAKTEADLMKPAVSGQIVEKYKDFPDVVRYFVCDDYRLKKIESEEERRIKQYRKEALDKRNSGLSSLYNII